MSLSKKIRFEVFKRDGFQCQYCGRTPPDIMLEVDHIKPRAKKGKDDMNNLLSACFDCNRGKGKIQLKTIPNALSMNLEILKEKEEQLEVYNELLEEIEQRLQVEILEINDAYNSYFKGYEFADHFKNSSLRKFLKHLPKQIVLESLHEACSFIISKGSETPADSAIKYFCGICWKKIKDPENSGVKE